MAELFEEVKKKALTTEQRDDLPEKTFGIPELRKFPLNDRKHVRQAVIVFNHVSPEYEKELARNIKRAMAKFKIKMNVSEQNRFNKYYGGNQNNG